MHAAPIEIDVAIIGGGPAGSACALALGGHRSTVLFDAGSRKLCGGLLNLESVAQLRALGLDVESSLGNRNALFDPLRPGLDLFDLDLTGPGAAQPLLQTNPGYLNVCRTSFDDWLLQNAGEAAGVEVRRNTSVRRVERRGEKWIVSTADGPVVAARNLVIASGYFGLSGMVPGYRPPMHRTYVALQASLPVPVERISIALSRRHGDYFGWVIPKGEATVAGVAVPPKRRRDGEDLIREMADRFLGVDWAGGQLRGCPIAVPANRTEPNPFVLPGAYAIGEAAGFVSPASGDGISYALETGRLVGSVLATTPVAASDEIIERRINSALYPARRRLDRQIIKANIMNSRLLRRIGARLLDMRVALASRR